MFYARLSYFAMNMHDIFAYIFDENAFGFFMGFGFISFFCKLRFHSMAIWYSFSWNDKRPKWNFCTAELGIFECRGAYRIYKGSNFIEYKTDWSEIA